MSEETVTVAKATRKRAPKPDPALGGPSAVPVTESPTAKATSATAQPPALAFLDRYEVVEVHRTEVKNAKYNPRIISDAARRKLKAGIEKLGNLAPLIWNRRTGNIVGGHQRISVFDSVYGTKNYKLRVSAVDLDDKQEREANILLNNPQAMGTSTSRSSETCSRGRSTSRRAALTARTSSSCSARTCSLHARTAARSS